MSKIWIFMLIMSLGLLIFSSPASAISIMISASKNSIELCLELLAIYAVWLGILQIMDDSRLSDKIARGLSRPIDFCFGAVSMSAKRDISLNISSNILGLGGAATPFGIRAMQALDHGKPTATRAMIMLVVINSTGIQLLPTTVIGMRAMAGSASASSIILPSILVTVIPTIIGILLVKLFYKRAKYD